MATSRDDFTNVLCFYFNRRIKWWILKTTLSFRTFCSPDRYRSGQHKVLNLAEMCAKMFAKTINNRKSVLKIGLKTALS